MKMTIIVDNKGALVAAQYGSSKRSQQADLYQQGGLLAGPGQRLHEVDVPDEVGHLRDAKEFLTRIKPHLPKI
jgi:hypothetical protein